MMTWTSFHLHYRDDQDRMLVDCIRPAISRAASMGMSRWFFLRHWKGGAHVRLRFCVPQPAAVATVKELSELIDEYFARFPSRAAPPDEKVLAGLRRLAWLEDDRSGDIELVADNLVILRPYAPEHSKYGGPFGVQLAEALFCESSVVALETVSATMGMPSKRLVVGFAMMLGALRA